MIKYIIKMIFITCFFFTTIEANEKPLKILTIQSYSQNLPWTMQFKEGI